MAVLNATFENTLNKLIEEKKYSSIKDILVLMDAKDLAAIFELIEEKNIPLVFRLLPKEKATDTFVEMESDYQELLIRSFSDTELKDILAEMYVDDAVNLVEEMPSIVVQRILNQVNPEKRKDINQILQYPENSAGSIMTTEFVSLNMGTTVGDAIKQLRRTGINKKSFYSCYITENRKLVGRISVKDLLLADNDEMLIDSLVKTNVIHVNTHDDQEEVSKLLSKYNFYAIPVVDSDEKIVGIITLEDAINVMEDEVTEDMEIMRGMAPSDKTYMHSSPFYMFKHRILWLMFLMISATFTGIIINHFENALAVQVVLTAFIPMLMDTGGNAGSQSSAMIMRAISLEEINFKDLPKAILKEASTALLCGAVLAVVCFAKIMLIDRLLLGNTDVTFMVALVVCIAMVATILIAKILGCVLPLCAKKIGLDPAVMASPLITTIADALSLLVYFGVANIFLFK